MKNRRKKNNNKKGKKNTIRDTGTFGKRWCKSKNKEH